MKIQIDIPDIICTKLNELGTGKAKMANVFRAYLNTLMEDDYEQFQDDFNTWLDALTDEELTDIQNGNNL
jgi:hypothetical protein